MGVVYIPYAELYALTDWAKNHQSLGDKNPREYSVNQYRASTDSMGLTLYGPDPAAKSESPFLSLYLLADSAKDKRHYGAVQERILKENPRRLWQPNGHDRVTLDRAYALGVYRRLSNSSTYQSKIYGPDPKHFDDLKSVEPASTEGPALYVLATSDGQPDLYKAIYKSITGDAGEWSCEGRNTYDRTEVSYKLGLYRLIMQGPNATLYGPDPREFEHLLNVPEEDAKPETSAVDHPEHYGGDNTYEVIKVIEAWELDFPLGNAVKYIARAGKKDAGKTVEDLEKAIWYINRKIKSLRD